MFSRNFKQPSNMTHDFARIPQANMPRSQFRSPYTYKTDLSAGWLVPFARFFVLPGDTFNDRFSLKGYLATPIKPVLDNLWLDTFYFYVPYRLLMDNFERLMGAQDDPDSSTDYLLPIMQVPVGGFAANSLYDYFGIPIEAEGLPFVNMIGRAYNLIWNEFFRDQNLQDSIVVDLDDGPDNPADYVLKKRGKRFDYVTSSLPRPQKGPAASLAFTGNAPVLGLGFSNSISYNQSPSNMLQSDGSSVTGSNWSGPISGLTTAVQGDNVTKVPNVFADLTGASAFTINDFRTTFQLQMLLENDARGGTRYTEILRAHFNVISPDFRLQRPEYLGGSTTAITMARIPQTSQTDGSPQGNLAAYGEFTAHDGYSKSFVEHGLIIALCSVRADLTYQNCLSRHLSARTRYDFYWPAFAHLGEMAVLRKEVYAKGTAGGTWDNEVWGYQEYAAHYRYEQSLITGKMRSSDPQSIDIWHYSEDLIDPVLSDEFIEDNSQAPLLRSQAVQDEPPIILDVYGDLVRARCMPVNSTPGLITRL